jgi:hypothetical protein
MSDSIELFEILGKGKIFSIRLSKPFYELWYVGSDKEKDVKISQFIGLNYVKTEHTNGIQMIIWGLNIMFAWGKERNGRS